MQQGMLFNFTTTSDNHDDQSSSTCLDFIETFLEKLKHSLSLCLVHFYPLAGRLATQKFPDDHASLIFVDCDKGPGARVLHASLDLNVSDLLSPTGHVSPAVRSLFDVGELKVNYDGHTHPLLSIQVTELLDGVFIGFTMNHCVADGTSFLHIISALSEIFLTQSDTMFRKPIPKPIFLEGCSPPLKLHYFEPEEFVTRLESGPLRERIFHFSPASIAALKAKANEECGVVYISSFKALSGFVWRSITRARGSKPEEETALSIPINSRPRLDPPLSEDYFGNFACGTIVSSTVGQLLSHGLGRAALMVHEHVVTRDNKEVSQIVDWFANNSFVIKCGSDPKQVIFACSTKSNMYGSEFGFGRALAVVSGYGNIMEGGVIASQGREGKGSVDLQIVLKPETMSALEYDEEFTSFVSLSISYS